MKPELVHAVDSRGNTILHAAATCGDAPKQLIERLLTLIPHALHALNFDGNNPFHLAVKCRRNKAAIQAMQLQLTFDQVTEAFHTHNKASYEKTFLKPLVERQCACLEELLLHPDVAAIVHLYLTG